MQRTRTASHLVVALALCGTAAAQLDDFEPAVEVVADGKAIDLTKDIGHAGPLLRDHDGDGKLDLLVSSFSGKIELFHNVGSRTAPTYESRGKLKLSDGNDLKFHNW
ncbi:MAG: hypothetical protein AAF726_19660 [Planctomycetota bacterium]